MKSPGVITLTRGRTYEANNTLLVSGVATAPAGGSDTRFVVKWRATDPDSATVFSCVVGDGVTYSGGPGEFTLKISAAKTADLPSSDGRLSLFYELMYVTGADVYTLDSGRLYIQPSVGGGV
jgi:hypothetical protein